MTKTGIIYGINGPIVHVKGDAGFEMHEMVTVGGDHLVGEVIGLSSTPPPSRCTRRPPASSRERLWRGRALPCPPPWPPAS